MVENAGRLVCGKSIDKKGFRGICDKPLNHPAGCSTEELRARNRGDQRNSRKKKRDEADGGTIKKNEALDILAERGVKNPYVQGVVYSLLTWEAESHGIPANRFLFQNGLIKTLESIDTKKEQLLPSVPPENIVGELLNRAELYALYDAAWATQELTTFEQFLGHRLRVKKDAFYSGRYFLGMEGFTDCHEVWRDFFPKLDPTTLPANYTLKQATEWLASQSEVLKDFLLMASRRAYKSTFLRVWLASLIVTFPDARILIVSETRPLSKDNIEALRGFFESQPGIENPYIRFQRLFPEMTIPTGDGSVLSLECPMRHLRLPQSVESSSMDSTVAGRRSDIIVFDDVISDVSCTNDIQIAKSVQKRDLLVKLKNKGGLTITLGTPWHFNDLYSQMIHRAAKNEDATFMYRIDPAFQVKPEFEFKLTPMLLSTLQESDVETFLMPENLSWKDLRPDMMNNPPFFLSQNLCMFPKAQDEGMRVQFEPDELRKHWKPTSFFNESPAAQVVIGFDRAFSQARYADYSCIAVAKIQQVENKQAMVIWDVRMDRWKDSDFVKNVIEMIERYQPTLLIAEKDRSWEDLQNKIRSECMARGIRCPRPHFKDIPNSPMAKARRVKFLELPLQDGRFWFTHRVTEDQLHQFEIFDGQTKSNSTRKDDFPDVCANLWETSGPRYESEYKQINSEERERLLEQEAKEARETEQYARVFGMRLNNSTLLHTQRDAEGFIIGSSDQSGQMLLSEWRHTSHNPGEAPPTPAPERKSTDPRDRVFSYGKFVKSGDRNKLFGVNGPYKNKD